MYLHKSATALKRFPILCAAVLALPLAVGLAAPAAAEPTFSRTETVTVIPRRGSQLSCAERIRKPGNEAPGSLT